MSRVTLLLVALCLLFVLALGSTPQSSQQLNVPHELHEHELTDHYGEGRDPRFESETDADSARHPEGAMKHKPSAATGYYPPPPPPAPPVPPSVKHKEAKAQTAAAEQAAAEEAAAQQQQQKTA